jgi:hypothetical protein
MKQAGWGKSIMGSINNQMLALHVFQKYTHFVPNISSKWRNTCSSYFLEKEESRGGDVSKT